MDPSEPRKERRLHAREIVLKEATITTEDAEIGCSVRNQHENGAELRVAAGVKIPDRFVLHIQADGATYRAVVRWRRSERLGVQLYGGSPDV
ncbi:PilZ domain-containing protein [Mesorhizobium amorphae]|uniref:PilZ domain-containing protein n=1 Tax=Mesorhizobium amorphae TaxID=71433 RepID=UPI001FEF8F01|nr:PilZ domain-containing protein [Mesorhizobium amorphae]